jgi:hypothetical protein
VGEGIDNDLEEIKKYLAEISESIDGPDKSDNKCELRTETTILPTRADLKLIHQGVPPQAFPKKSTGNYPDLKAVTSL